MFTKKTWFLCASTILLAAANCKAQECVGCENPSFGYPATAVEGNGTSTRNHPIKENWHAWKAESAKSYARNDAWPKPFACQDKMTYYSVWDVMINQGYAINCVLGPQHFNPDNNELNPAGLIKVAKIFQNLPTDRRHLLITRDVNDAVSQARIDHVNQVVQTYHGQSSGNMIVALTDMQPSMMSGVQADAIAKRQLEGLPAPIIPASTIGTGVSNASGQ